DDQAEGDRPLLDQPPAEAGGAVAELPGGAQHALPGGGADAGLIVHRARDGLAGHARPFRDVDDRRPARRGAHRVGDFRSSQAISCAESSTPRPSVDERISPIVRGPNSAKVGNFWCSTKASAIAVAGTPRSRPSSSARARRSKFSSL